MPNLVRGVWTARPVPLVRDVHVLTGEGRLSVLKVEDLGVSNLNFSFEMSLFLNESVDVVHLPSHGLF